MKRLSAIFSVLLVFFTLASTASASSPDETYNLQPSLNTEVEFEDVELVSNGDDYTFSITQEFDAEEKISSEYDIEVDLNNLTYTVNEKEVLSTENEMARATVKHLFVAVQTYDPVGIKLNHTEAKLWWSPGSSATKVAGNKICTPSKKPTTWFNNSCVVNSDGSRDGGKTYAYGVSGGYYNYDFLSSKKRTDVNHHIFLEGYKDGKSSYRATWNKSGEAAFLLHFNTLVTKN